jgi:hypothetical protein
VVVSAVKREKPYRAELQRGLLAGLCALAACIPNAGPLPPVPPPGPIGTGASDPGWRTVDCAAAEAGLEFAPFTIADFEQQRTNSSNAREYFGHYMYSYTDATAQVYANGDGTQAPVGYEPIAASANVCNSDTHNHVLHVTGGPGPYLGWGGGIGVAMQHLSQDAGLCPWGMPPQYDFCPPTDEGDAVSTTTLDMSKWDGVAVWARRGPDSQPLLRVLVGNKYTDDDISFLQYGADPKTKRYCERSRECACINGKACTFWDTGASATFKPGYYCGDPAADPQPGTISGNGVQGTNSCNITRCNEPYPAYPNSYGGVDPQFYGRPCTPYAFRGGGQSSYCFDPATDQPPAESDQGCGDYWTFPLHLTTEWQLFLVPFTTMTQQGWAKRWSFFDIKSVSVVRLTWDAGWIDYWIDNLRFYRVRR